MNPPNRLCENLPDLQNLQLALPTHVLHSPQVLLLRDAVGHDNFVETACVDALDGITGEDAVGNEGDDARGAGALEQLCGTSDGVGCVGEIVDQDCGAVDDRAHQKKGSVLAVVGLGWSAFLYCDVRY